MALKAWLSWPRDPMRRIRPDRCSLMAPNIQCLHRLSVLINRLIQTNHIQRGFDSFCGAQIQFPGGLGQHWNLSTCGLKGSKSPELQLLLIIHTILDSACTSKVRLNNVIRYSRTITPIRVPICCRRHLTNHEGDWIGDFQYMSAIFGQINEWICAGSGTEAHPWGS